MENLPEDPQFNADFIGLFDLIYLWALYVIYAISGAVVLLPSQTLLAGIAITLAMFLTRVKKKEKHPVLATHYQWLNRTFWLGMGLYLSVYSLLTIIIAGPAVDGDALMEAVTSGQASTPEEMSDLLMAQQPASSKYMIIGMGVIFALWWMWRCGAGMYALYQQRGVSNPESWV